VSEVESGGGASERSSDDTKERLPTVANLSGGDEIFNITESSRSDALARTAYLRPASLCPPPVHFPSWMDSGSSVMPVDRNRTTQA
jgi:hypothetical protein